MMITAFAATAAGLALTTTAAGQPATDGGPRIDAPVLATIHETTLTIPGSGFGEAGPDAWLMATLLDGTRFNIASTAPFVSEWSDERIIVEINETARSGSLRVHTAKGVSNRTRVEVYTYDWFDIPPTPGTNAPPLAIAAGTDGHLWVNQEFHLEFQHFDPAVGVVEGLPIPKPVDPGPFATTLFSDHRTQTSVLGEDILVDPQGRVWFTQGGGSLYSGEHPNHSRIVCYIPDAPKAERYRVYNMPGDWNEIIGLAWDAGRQRMWVAQGGLTRRPAIASFDPERIPWDNDFDFSESLMRQVCESGEPEDDCYRVYPLPESSLHPAHLEVDGRGLVWYTAYWGNAIGVVNPETGRVIEYPLPAPIGLGDPVWIVGSGPWQMVKAPDNGDIVFCEFFDSTIGRFSVNRVLDPLCRELNGEGVNPCIDEWVIPDVDLRNETVHSIGYDLEGRLWYTIHTVADFEGKASLGFITADWRDIVRLPSLEDFPGEGNASAAGIAIDPVTGDIYFSEFWRHRIGRLRRVD